MAVNGAGGAKEGTAWFGSWHVVSVTKFRFYKRQAVAQQVMVFLMTTLWKSKGSFKWAYLRKSKGRKPGRWPVSTPLPTTPLTFVSFYTPKPALNKPKCQPAFPKSKLMGYAVSRQHDGDSWHPSALEKQVWVGA